MALRMAESRTPLWIVLVLVAVLGGVRATNFCTHVVEPSGYGCTEYTVQTADGFVLVLHRLERINSMFRTGRSSVSNSSASNLPSQMQAPAGNGNRRTADHVHLPNADVSSNGLSQDGRIPGQATGTPPTSERSSVSSNSRTPEDSLSKQAAGQAGPAPSTSTQNASSSSSTPNTQSSPSNHTANSKAGKGSPVLLMHMEFLNGEMWFQYVDADRHVTSLLPMMLLEDGFDVWIGHQRATYWGHGHVQHKPTDREYWNWTWDEHTKHDLPAQLRFVLTETNQKVHYIGFSEAAAVAVAGATDSETVKLFRSLTLIGPTVFRGHTNSLMLNAWAYVFGAFLDSRYYATGFQHGAFNYSSEFPQTGPISGTGIAGMAIGLISGPNCCLGSATLNLNSNGWDGTTSFKNLLHWQQGIRTNTFAHYDYGSAANNTQTYGQPVPPSYNIGKIPSQLPVLIVGGGNDWSAPPEGIRSLVSQMQQPPTIVNLTNYAHFDLFFSVKRETDIYLPILQFLEGSKFE